MRYTGEKTKSRCAAWCRDTMSAQRPQRGENDTVEYLMQKHSLGILLSIMISAVCVLAGCASPVVTLRDARAEDEPAAVIHYTDFWSAFRCGDEEQMLSLAYLPEQHVLTRAFTYSTQRKWREAASLLDSLQCTTLNDTARNLSGVFLHESRRLLGLWADGCADTCVVYPNSTNPRLECLYAQAAPVSVTFGKDADTIPLCIKRGIPIVSVAINGKEYDFIFDTGAQQTAVYGFSARESSVRVLAEQEYKVGSSTGSAYTARAGLVDSLSVAGVKFANLPCYVFDAEHLEDSWLFFTTFSCDGILGWDVIQHLDVTIDYANSRLIMLRPQKKDIGTLPPSLLWLEHPLISAKTVSGLPLWFVFDSGASRSSLVADVITQKIPDMAMMENQQTVTTVGGKERIDGYKIENFSLYLFGYTCSISSIELRKERDGLIAVDGVLGGDVFREGAVHIDYTNGIFEFVVGQE